MSLRVKADGREMAKLARQVAKAEKQRHDSAVRRMKAGLYVLASDAEDVYRSLTPVRTERLKKSTRATVIAHGENAGSVEVRQPAENAAGQEYWQWVVFPHRIVTRSGVDTGRMTKGNPYPTQANAQLRPAMDRAQLRYGHDATIDCIAVIKGQDGDLRL